MIRTLQLGFITAGLLAISACGGGGYSVNPAPPKASTQALTAGNWWIVGTSNTLTTSGASTQIDLSGPLAVSGNTISVTSTANSSTCFPNKPIVISGPASSGALTLTSPATASAYGFILTVQGTTKNSTLLDGTYQLAGGTNLTSCKADVGTVYGSYVPALTGTLAGNVTETDPNSQANVASLSIAFSQGATPAIFAVDIFGTTVSAFPLSGSVTWGNANCYGSGVLDPTQSYIAGNSVNMVVTASAGGYPSYGIFTKLDNPASTTRGMAVTLLPGSGPCAAYNITGLLTSS